MSTNWGVHAGHIQMDHIQDQTQKTHVTYLNDCSSMRQQPGETRQPGLQFVAFSDRLHVRVTIYPSHWHCGSSKCHRRSPVSKWGFRRGIKHEITPGSYIPTGVVSGWCYRWCSKQDPPFKRQPMYAFVGVTGTPLRRLQKFSFGPYDPCIVLNCLSVIAEYRELLKGRADTLTVWRTRLRCIRASGARSTLTASLTGQHTWRVWNIEVSVNLDDDTFATSVTIRQWTIATSTNIVEQRGIETDWLTKAVRKKRRRDNGIRQVESAWWNVPSRDRSRGRVRGADFSDKSFYRSILTDYYYLCLLYITLFIESF